MSLAKAAFLHLKRKKLRTALLVLSVALSLSMLIGITAGVEGLQTTYKNLVTNTLGYTDLIIKSNSTNPNFTMAEVENALKENAVAAYSWRTVNWLPFVSKNETFNTSNGALLVGANPETDEPFGEYAVAAGNFTSIASALKNSPDSCIVGETLAVRLDLHAGDTLFLGGYNSTEPLPTKPQQVIQLTVVGTIRDFGRAYWFDAKNPDSFWRINADILANLNVTQNLLFLSSGEVNHVYVHVNDLTKAESVKESLESSLGSNYSIIDLKVQMLDSVKQSFSSFQSIGYVVGGMAMMIAVMLLLNSMLAGVNERRHEIGILRSIGASKGQVFGQFLVETLPVAVLGALVSIPLSMLMARIITSALPVLYVQNVGLASAGIEFNYSVTTLLTGLGIGFCVTLATGVVPAVLASRIDIVRALYPQMRSFGKAKKWRVAAPISGVVLLFIGLFLVRAGFSASSSWLPNAQALVGYTATLVGAVLLASLFLPLLSKLFSQFLRLSLGRASILVQRNILLNFRRSVFAYGAFAISIALLIGLSSLVTTSASYDLSNARYGHGSDMQVWASAPPSFADYLKSVDGVKNAAGVGLIGYQQNNMSCNGQFLNGKGILLIGVDSTDYFETIYGIHLVDTLNGMTPNEVYSTMIAEPKNVILQDALAKNLNAHVGDEVTWLLTVQTGTSEMKLHVIATTDSVAGNAETLYKSMAASGYYMAIMRFQDMLAFRDPALAGSNFDEFLVSVEPSANVTQVVDDITQYSKQQGYTLTVSTVQQRLAQSEASYAQAETLVLTIASFFIVVGAMGIAAAMAYTVYERKREIGLLSAMGLSRRQNFAIIAGEALLLALIGTAVGFASGLGLSVFTLQSIQWWSSLPAPALAVSPLTIAASIVVITVSAVLSSVYPANRVMKLDVVEALRK